MNVFDYAMRMEVDGQAYYEKLARETQLVGLRTIFTRLAADTRARCAPGAGVIVVPGIGELPGGICGFACGVGAGVPPITNGAPGSGGGGSPPGA